MPKKRKTKKAVPGIEQMSLKNLQPAAYNPRTISDDALAALAKSMERFGLVEPIVVNVRGGKNVIVGGHQRHKALMAAGATCCTCVTVDISKADEKLLNITLNNPLAQGEFIAELGDYIDKLKPSPAPPNAEPTIVSAITNNRSKADHPSLPQ